MKFVAAVVVFSDSLVAHVAAVASAGELSLRSALADPMVTQVKWKKDMRTTTIDPSAPVAGSRLDMDGCKEPTDDPAYGHPYAGSFGPEKIKCCRTAQEVLKKLKKRCEDCHDAVPCSRNMEEKWCPQALKHYEAMQDDVCRPLPPTEAPSKAEAEAAQRKQEQAEAERAGEHEAGQKRQEEAKEDGKKKAKSDKEGEEEGEKKKKESKEDDEKKAKEEEEEEGGKKKAKKEEEEGGKKKAAKEEKKKEEKDDDELAWCYEMCGKMVQAESCKDEDKCKQFCQEAKPKFAEMAKKD